VGQPNDAALIVLASNNPLALSSTKEVVANINGFLPIPLQLTQQSSPKVGVNLFYWFNWSVQPIIFFLPSVEIIFRDHPFGFANE
jgi:hypothetical protein